MSGAAGGAPHSRPANAGGRRAGPRRRTRRPDGPEHPGTCGPRRLRPRGPQPFPGFGRKSACNRREIRKTSALSRRQTVILIDVRFSFRLSPYRRTFSSIALSFCSINGQEKVRHDVMEVSQRPGRDPGLEDGRKEFRFRSRHPVLQGQRGSVRQAADKCDRTCRRAAPHEHNRLAIMGMVPVPDG